MKHIVLLTGSNGWVGKAVLRCAHEFNSVQVLPIERESAAIRILEARQNFPQASLSLINLAWPSLHKYSATDSGNSEIPNEWGAYKTWLLSLADAAAQSDVRFFQVGSGVEPYGLGDAPVVCEPYLSYCHHKDEAWRLIQATLPDSSWRLRLHFLFGAGEKSHRFIPTAIRAAEKKQPVTLGAPSRRRCWLNVDDAARGLMRGVLQDVPSNWDICGTVAVSFDELLIIIGDAIGTRIVVSAAEQTVADAACIKMVPHAAAPFVAENAGGPSYLAHHLAEYAKLVLAD